MARIMRDYKCEEHGYFEAYAPVCPDGCEKGVMMVFLQAPGLVSAKTKKNDKTVRKLADDFKMTNVKSTREGESQAGYYTRQNSDVPKEVAEAQQVREARPGVRLSGAAASTTWQCHHFLKAGRSNRSGVSK